MLQWMIWTALLIGGSVFWFKVSMRIFERWIGDDRMNLHGNITLSYYVCGAWAVLLILGFLPA